MQRRMIEMKVQRMLRERELKLEGRNLMAADGNSIQTDNEGPQRSVVTGTYSSDGYSGFHN